MHSLHGSFYISPRKVLARRLQGNHTDGGRGTRGARAEHPEQHAGQADGGPALLQAGDELGSKDDYGRAAASPEASEEAAEQWA